MQSCCWLSAVEFEQIISSVTKNYIIKGVIYSEKCRDKGSGMTYYYVLTLKVPSISENCIEIKRPW